MHTCSLSVTRTPPSRPSATAAAAVTPPVLLMKVRSIRFPFAFFGNACSVFVDANPVALSRRQVEKPARTRPRRTSSTS